MDLAQIDLGDLDLFEYQRTIKNNHKEQTIGDYLKYLTQGNQPNQLIYEFSKSLKKALGADLISRFNLKSLDLIDSLVEEVLNKIKVKDACGIQPVYSL